AAPTSVHSKPMATPLRPHPWSLIEITTKHPGTDNFLPSTYWAGTPQSEQLHERPAHGCFPQEPDGISRLQQPESAPRPNAPHSCSLIESATKRPGTDNLFPSTYWA